MSLPPGWAKAKIGALCDLINGRAFKPADWSSEGMPIIRIQNLNRSSSTFNYCNFEVDPRFIVQPGELLFAWSGTPGTSFGAHIWNGPKAVLNQHIFRVAVQSDEVDKNFLRAAINSTLEVLIQRAHGGVGLAHVTRGEFEATDVLLPPFAEQRRIVTKLDALTLRLARAKGEISRARHLLIRCRLAILEAAFRQFANEPRARIDKLCRVGTGSTPKRGEARYYVGGTVPWITSGVVNRGFVSEASEHITNAALKETNCKVFPSGSILVALYGEGKTRGMVATLGIAAATNQALAVLYDFDQTLVSPDWIQLFLLARYQETRSAASGGVQPNLNLGIVKAIELPLPPVAEQQEVVAKVRSAFARAERLDAEASKALALIERLEAAILAKAFRGGLVPQDPNDEPASVLLERIRARRAGEPKPRRGRRPRPAEAVDA